MALGALGLSFLTGPFGQKSLGYILLVLSLIGLIAVVLFLVGRSVAVHYISRLQKAYQRAEIEDHAEDLVQWFAKPEARADLVQKHQEHLHDLARTAIALFGAARSLSLAVVVAGAVVGLATLFITYTQTELLDEQNERFDRQNTLLAFEQTSRLRQLLFRAPLDTSGTPVENYLPNYHIEDY